MIITRATKKDISDLAELDMLMSRDEKKLIPELNLKGKDVNYYKKTN
jgi:hypothetical protein